MSQAPSPTQIDAPRGSLMMTIDWSDGEQSRHPHHVLRGFCPCANCQGHKGPIKYIHTKDPKALVLSDIEEVGNYALRMLWADGHATGIYTHRFLRQLQAHADAEPTALIDVELGR